MLRASALALTLLATGRVAAAETPPPASPSSGSPSTPTEAEVDEHVAQGHRLYQLGRYQEAIAEYRRAYELRADPQFLFQIAESYLQLGASEQALFYYDRYLAGAAEGPDRDAAEERVSEIERLRARPAAATLLAVIATLENGGKGAKRHGQTPLQRRRWWLWTAIGVALAAGVTAAALTGRSESSVPTTDLGDRKFF